MYCTYFILDRIKVKKNRYTFFIEKYDHRCYSRQQDRMMKRQRNHFNAQKKVK